MIDGPVPAPREQGWIRIVLALAAFLLLPHTPGLPAMMPVVDTLLLLVPALAACFIVGWWRGGSFALAFIWTALAIWLCSLPVPRGVSPAYYDLARGWGLLVAGTFGVVCLLGRQRSFIHRALSAVGVAVLLALALLTAGRHDLREAERVFTDELAARNTASEAIMRESARRISEQAPRIAEMANQVATQRSEVQAALARVAVPLAPALLGLEALAACALAWALYHRLSRTRIGDPLTPLRRFAFSDQLVWAIVAGLSMMLVPTLAPLGVVGRNLVVFFGTLYVLRGYGIYAWFLSRRAAVASLTLAVVLFPLSLVTVPAALGLGLSDTWLDWRRRVATPPKGGRSA
jgi:hypothetical protein